MPMADQEFSCLLLSVNGCGYWWMLEDIKERILDSNLTKAYFSTNRYCVSGFLNRAPATSDCETIKRRDGFQIAFDSGSKRTGPNSSGSVGSLCATAKMFDTHKNGLPT
jgi:hypothetical protein